MDKRHLLLIDEDADFADQLRSQLSPYGFEIHQVSETGNPLGMVADIGPEIVLIAVELPDRVGYSLCNKAKKGVAKDIPVVLTTQSVPPSGFQSHRKLRVHADEYIDKREAGVDEVMAVLKGLIDLETPLHPEFDGVGAQGSTTAPALDHTELVHDDFDEEATSAGGGLPSSAIGEFDYHDSTAINTNHVAHSLRDSSLLESVSSAEDDGIEELDFDDIAIEPSVHVADYADERVNVIAEGTPVPEAIRAESISAHEGDVDNDVNDLDFESLVSDGVEIDIAVEGDDRDLEVVLESDEEEASASSDEVFEVAMAATASGNSGETTEEQLEPAHDVAARDAFDLEIDMQSGEAAAQPDSQEPLAPISREATVDQADGAANESNLASNSAVTTTNETTSQSSRTGAATSESMESKVRQPAAILSAVAAPVLANNAVVDEAYALRDQVRILQNEIAQLRSAPPTPATNSFSQQRELMSLKDSLADRDRRLEYETKKTKEAQQLYDQLLAEHEQVKAEVRKHKQALDDYTASSAQAVENERQKYREELYDLRSEHEGQIALLAQQHVESMEKLREQCEVDKSQALLDAQTHANNAASAQKEVERLTAEMLSQADALEKRAREAHQALQDQQAGQVARLQREHSDALEALRRENETTLEEARGELTLASEQALTALRLETDDAHRQALEQKAAEHSAKVASLTEKYEAQTSSLVAQYEQRIETLKNESSSRISELETQSASRISQLEFESVARLNEFETESATRISQLETQSAERIQELQDRLEDALQQHVEYQGQIVKAFEKVRNDSDAMTRAKKALAIALTVLDEVDRVGTAPELESSEDPQETAVRS